MSQTMEKVLEEIRAGLLENQHGPAFVLGQHIVLTIENMIDVCRRCEEMLSDDDTISIMSMVDVLTATSVFLTILRIDKDKAAEMIMSGYNLAFASRFFDLPPTNLDDPKLERKIAVSKQLIAANAKVQKMKQERLKKSETITSSIISNMKTAH